MSTRNVKEPGALVMLLAMQQSYLSLINQPLREITFFGGAQNKLVVDDLKRKGKEKDCNRHRSKVR
jgi:hypothetical protein